MKLVFFGTARFAVPALEAMEPHISLVVSQPDRPTGRGMKVQASPVKQRALELGLRVETPEKSRSAEFVERVRSEGADALLVGAYGQILSQALLDSATRGGINLHGSILPNYRGAAPIQRAILAGEKESGVTLMQMDKGMDTGDLIAIERTPIGQDETYGELEERLGRLAAQMAEAWMPRIAAGEYPRTPQDDSQATLAPKVAKGEAELDPGREARGEYDRYRAFTPSPGAFLRTKWGVLRVSKAAFEPRGDVPRAGSTKLTSEKAATSCPQSIPAAGTILETKASFVLAFAGGAIELVEVQPEGKKRMSGRDFANGMRLRPGMSILD